MQFRVYSGSDGQSHIEELNLTTSDVFQFPSAQGEELVFRRDPMPGWHNCPRRQFVITLSGQAELGFGDGSTQLLGPRRHFIDGGLHRSRPHHHCCPSALAIYPDFSCPQRSSR